MLEAAVIGVQTGPGLDSLGSQRGCSGDGGDRLDGELFRSHHRRQFRRIAAGDAVLHQQPDAAERRDDLLEGTAVKGRVPVAEFLPATSISSRTAAPAATSTHVMRKSDAGTSLALPGFDDPRSSASSVATISTAALVARLTTRPSKRSTRNSKAIPRSWRSSEPSRRFSPTRRLSPAPSAGCWSRTFPQIPTPPGSRNNGGGKFVALGPAVLQRNGNTIAADFSGSFSLTTFNPIREPIRNTTSAR